MIEALKIIMLACQLISPPKFDSGFMSFTKMAIKNQKINFENQIQAQRQCQKKLIKCWLKNKREKVKWPLSTCLAD